MRIAWLGPLGGGAGNPPLGNMLLGALLDAGATVDVYHQGTGDDIPARIREHPGAHVRAIATEWSWDRWYSRTKLSAFISGLAVRSFDHLRLTRWLLRQHRETPYDCIFQFSQPELFVLGLLARRLPPIVVHPGTHAAGELRWHRAESAYARSSERFAFHYLTRLMLIVRSAMQRHDLKRAALVLCPSTTFMCEVERDYGLEPERMRVLRHPVDLDRFSPDGGPRDPERTIVILFVARMAVRKGLELIVGLSHRLSDLQGRVRIDLIGDRGLWSNYLSHLREINPRVAVYVGPTAPDDLAALLRSADALLVPSLYEPGSLIAGQALASGLPLIASDRVGPAEVVSKRCCRVFASGDLDALERVTRELVDELRTDFESLSGCAREQAVTLMREEVIGARLAGFVAEAVRAGGRP